MLITKETDDPAEVISAIHAAGRALGYERVRIDRSQYPVGSGREPKCWFEVGYGCGEVLIRTNTDRRYRSVPGRVDLVEVQQLLGRLIEEADS